MYYVFGGENYYPAGGGNDLIGFNDDLFTAITIATSNLNNKHTDWVTVFGTDDQKGLVLEWEAWKKHGKELVVKDYTKKED